MLETAKASPSSSRWARRLTATKTSAPTEILNSICREGWHLVTAAFVFHELGSESRDKFMASGRYVAVKGTIRLLPRLLPLNAPVRRSADEESTVAALSSMGPPGFEPGTDGL